MAAKTEEDWFLRGGERPNADNAFNNPDAHDGEFPPDSPHEGDDGEEEVLQDWIVTMSRTKTVQQTARVRVKAHSEEEALDLIEDRAEDEAENWAWKDNGDTEEFEDVEAVEAEVAP